MEDYTSKITLLLKTSAHSEDDVADLIEDNFAPGEYPGFVIEKLNVQHIAKDN